jgi:hypothetical protein
MMDVPIEKPAEGARAGSNEDDATAILQDPETFSQSARPQDGASPVETSGIRVDSFIESHQSHKFSASRGLPDH